MAVRNLSCWTLVYERRFNVPRRLNGDVVRYEICEGGVEFSRCDDGEVVLGRWNVPDGVRYMEFEKMVIGGDEVVGVPRFYDNGGNLLKIGNR